LIIIGVAICKVIETKFMADLMNADVLALIKKARVHVDEASLFTALKSL
jgi:hypothetical protein